MRTALDQCAASGQMDSRQIAAHMQADELAELTRRVQESEYRRQPVGYESALPLDFIGPEPTEDERDWTAIGIYCAVIAAVIFALIVACPVVPLR